LGIGPFFGAIYQAVATFVLTRIIWNHSGHVFMVFDNVEIEFSTFRRINRPGKNAELVSALGF
jgi:hypothetical protein